MSHKEHRVWTPRLHRKLIFKNRGVLLGEPIPQKNLGNFAL